MINEWNVELQTYVLEWKGYRIESNRPMTVRAPAALKALAHPPEPERVDWQRDKARGKVQVMTRPDQDKMNTGLGVQQRHVKERLRVIEGEEGRKLQEVGNEVQHDKPKSSGYDTIDMELVRHIKDTVE